MTTGWIDKLTSCIFNSQANICFNLVFHVSVYIYFQVSELTTQITEKQEELDQLRVSLDKRGEEGKKLENEITVMAEMNKDIER